MGRDSRTGNGAMPSPRRGNCALFPTVPRFAELKLGQLLREHFVDKGVGAGLSLSSLEVLRLPAWNT
jgi:hypothetical protein